MARKEASDVRELYTKRGFVDCLVFGFPILFVVEINYFFSSSRSAINQNANNAV